MNTKNLSDHDLLQLAKEKTRFERSVSLEVINLIKEIESRRLYSGLGFSSLFEFVTKELGYDESAALRRISAARLIRELPEIEIKIATNELNLTNLSMAQSFFRREEKSRAAKLTPTEKKAVLTRMENKSTREAQKILLQISPDNAQPQESVRQISEDLTQIKIVINNELKTKLETLKVLFAHKNPSMTYLELVDELANLALKKIEKSKTNRPPKDRCAKNLRDAISTENLRNKTSIEILRDTTSTESGSLKTNYSEIPAAPQGKFSDLHSGTGRYIPQKIKTQVWQRDEGCCSFISPITGRKCSSSFRLEFHHIIPFGKGGDHSVKNLTLLCQNHNQYWAMKDFGYQKMKQFIRF